MEQIRWQAGLVKQALLQTYGRRYELLPQVLEKQSRDYERGRNAPAPREPTEPTEPTER